MVKPTMPLKLEGLDSSSSTSQTSRFLSHTTYIMPPRTGLEAWHSIFLQHREDRQPETTITSTLSQLKCFSNVDQYDMASYEAVSHVGQPGLVRLKPASTGLKSATIVEDSPIQNLPPDVLGEIFGMICLGDYSLKIARPIPTKKNLLSSPTLVLTQVCSYWRCLVFSLPLLWSSLSIESRHLYGRPALASLVVTYISRSGSVPLKFYLKSDEDAPEVELRVFDALLEHASQWQEASLFVSPPWLVHLKMNLGSRLVPASICFPQLEHLVLNVQSDNHSEEDLMMMTYLSNQIIQSSPRLNVFRGLSYNYLSRGFGGIYGVKSSVTELVLHKFRGRSLSQLFSHFPNLKTCRIGGFEFSENALVDVDLADEIPPYTSKITHLCHATPWDTFQRGAWQSLRIPNLTFLDLHYSDYSLAELSSLLRQSGTSLSVVKLYNFAVVEIIEFLSSHPSVLRLCIHMDGELGLLDRLATDLTIATDSRFVVPRLQSFELSWNDRRYKRLRDLNAVTLQIGLRDAICRMAESRIPGRKAQGLQRLVLRILDGDFLEFESLYKMINEKLSSISGFNFETHTTPLPCNVLL